MKKVRGGEKEASDFSILQEASDKPKLNIELAHTFEHNSVVCCVTFSKDGNLFATGCNRKSFIFDVETGNKLQFGFFLSLFFLFFKIDFFFFSKLLTLSLLF